MITKSCLLITLFAALVAAPVQGLSSANLPVAQRTLINPAGVKGREPFDKLYGNLPLQFEPNRGQADPRFDFVTRGAGYGLALSAAEAVFVLNKKQPTNRRSVSALTMKLAGANRHARSEVMGSLPGRINYLNGSDPGKYHTGIKTYGQVRYANVYPGIDLVYYSRGHQLEYDFIVAPGAETDAIALQIEGAEAVRINDQSELVIFTGDEAIRFEKPFVYQEVNNQRLEITGQYVLKGPGRVAFSIGEYDHNFPLVIDPVLSYSSFLGGGGADSGRDIKLDSAGNIYITGSTTSPEFPHNGNVSHKGSFDVFVTKLNPSGTSLIFSTFIGAAGNDSSLSIALDGSNNIFLSGVTDSPDYPTTVGAFQRTLGSNQSAMVTKLSAAGDTIMYSTYLGGAGRINNGARMTVDPAGDIYLAGSTYSLSFPTTSNAFQPTVNTFTGTNFLSATDAFVAKIHPAGAGASDLVYSSYLGGNLGDGDGGISIALDAGGFVYIIGSTESTNFPTTPDALQPLPTSTDPAIRNGQDIRDAFFVKMDLRVAGAAGMIYSTYIGGTGNEGAAGIALDRLNNVYLTGSTKSTDFPVTKNAMQPANSGGNDAFIIKLNPSRAGAAGLIYSTYLGGSADDTGNAMTVDGVGNVYLTGDTRSTNLPVTVGAFQPSIGGVSDVFSAPGGDAFVAKLNAAGTALVYFTYLGGSGGDSASAITIDSKGDAYLTGYTFSPNFPLTSNALQTTQAGQFDAFVARVNNPSSFNPPGVAGKTEAASPVEPNSLLNPIDDAQKFVRQQYIDFLNREPDPNGLTFWSNEITSCGSDLNCVDVKRTNVSAAFFLSIEFQQTGYLVDRLYLTSFARTPKLPEFWPDTRQISAGVIVNSPGWEQVLENNKQAFVLAFVQRPEFLTAYPASMSADQFVNRLDTDAGNVLTSSERAQLVSILGATPGDSAKRASAVRTVAENSILQQREFNKAFVLMQYFGYLQRNPDDFPDGDLSGYNFWLGKLNQFNGNFIDAEMVKAFISAGEYRQRFGQN
jgi:Beta-propeller repeat/Domain of unknown function (DUF4214)